MTTIMLTCADADVQTRALAESGDRDGAAALLVEHAAAGGYPDAVHHRIHDRARLDTFSTGLFNLPADDLFARRAAAQHVAGLLPAD